MAASAPVAALSSFPSLFLRPSPSSSTAAALSLPKTTFCCPFLLSSAATSAWKRPTLGATQAAKSSDIDMTFFDEVDLNEDIPFDPPAPPEGYVPPVPFFELSPESEDEIAAAYEEMYGPAYSGVSVLGNDINVMDAKLQMTSFGTPRRKAKVRDGFQERLAEVRRVNKVVEGGKQLGFRAVVVVGNKQGQVGVGVGKATEVAPAVGKAAVNARRNIITVPITKYSTFPHRAEGKFGGAKVMLRPATPGSGVNAGGAVRMVIEMAGVQNALGKQLGSDTPLNNARATVVAILKMRLFQEVALQRGIPIQELWK